MKKIRSDVFTKFTNTRFSISMDSPLDPNHEPEVGTPHEICKCLVDSLMLWEVFSSEETVQYTHPQFGTLTYSIEEIV